MMRQAPCTHYPFSGAMPDGMAAGVLGSRNPARMSQAKAGNRVRGIRSGKGEVAGRSTLNQLTTPITPRAIPDQASHCGKLSGDN